VSYAPAKRPYPTPFGAYGVDADKFSKGQVTCLAEAAYADGDDLTLASETYEIDKGGGVAPGAIPLVLAGGETAEAVATILALAATANEPLLFVSRVGATVYFQARLVGPAYPIGWSGDGFNDGNPSGISGGQVGSGQPARFGPVRAMVPTAPETRMIG